MINYMRIWSIWFIVFLSWTVIWKLADLFFKDRGPAYKESITDNPKVYMVMRNAQDNQCVVDFYFGDRDFPNALVLGGRWGELPYYVGYSPIKDSIYVLERTREETIVTAPKVRFVKSLPDSVEGLIKLNFYREFPLESTVHSWTIDCIHEEGHLQHRTVGPTKSIADSLITTIEERRRIAISQPWE